MSDAVRELAGGKLLLDHPSAGVARLTISNPAKRNALDHPILDALAETLDEIEGGDVRAVIVTGAHGMFSAGYDIGEIPEEGFAETAERLVAHPFTVAIDRLEAFPYPTVAALSGHTIGGGLELALACDLRVAGASIRLGMPPARLSLVYSHTGLRRFIDAVGAPRTRELFLLGANIAAETALEWGLVNRLAEMDGLGAAALEMACTLAANAPIAQRGNKRVIGELLRARTVLEQGLESELIAMREASFRSRDMREGMAAFAEKRPPRWQDA